MNEVGFVLNSFWASKISLSRFDATTMPSGVESYDSDELSLCLIGSPCLSNFISPSESTE